MEASSSNDFEDFSNSDDDPSYTPELENISKKKSVLSDFFKAHSKHSGPSVEAKRLDVFLNLNEEIKTKISNCPYLDGKFFNVQSYDKKENKIVAECQLYLPKIVKIKENLGISTNFLRHLKTINSNDNVLKSYNDYKMKKKKKTLLKVERSII